MAYTAVSRDVTYLDVSIRRWQIARHRRHETNQRVILGDEARSVCLSRCRQVYKNRYSLTVMLLRVTHLVFFCRLDLVWDDISIRVSFSCSSSEPSSAVPAVYNRSLCTAGTQTYRRRRPRYICSNGPRLCTACVWCGLIILTRIIFMLLSSRTPLQEYPVYRMHPD